MSEGLIIGPKSVATGQSRSSANCCSTALFIRLRPLSSAVKCALDQMRNAIEDSEIGHLEADWMAGHIRFELATPSARYLIGIP